MSIPTTKYHGVEWCEQRQAWLASVWMPTGRRLLINVRSTAANAAIDYDNAAWWLWRWEELPGLPPLNFPHLYDVPESSSFFPRPSANVAALCQTLMHPANHRPLTYLP